MKYLVLVSHGEFAAGLKTSLMMLAGQRDDVIASGYLMERQQMNLRKSLKKVLRTFMKMMKLFY